MSFDTHYFIGVPVAEHVATRIGIWVNENKEKYSFKKWVDPQDYHITLSFLGKASDLQLEKLKQQLPMIVHEIPSFELMITHFGQFGESASPRILWVGTEESALLASLQKEVEDACSIAGFVAEARKYNPHITVARNWQGHKSFQLPVFSDINTLKDLGWDIPEICLYRSHLDRIPKYECLMKFALKEARRG
jgi:2'-5' RNA ligase